MPLWGKTDADESKPKWLTDDQKKEVFANNSGWVVEGGSAQTGNGNANAQPEILACIGGLSTVRVRWNEAVTVTGNPTLAVTNGNQGTGSGRGPHTLVYASGTGSNELVFSLAIAAANAATNADDVLTVAAQNVLKPGGATIKDASGTASDSAVAISGAQGTACGSITVVA